MSESPRTEASALPIFLRLQGRRVVVVGGGDAAAAKLRLLRPTDAAIVVVAAASSDAVDAMAAAGDIELHRRHFVAADLDGAHLCIAAVSDPAPIAAAAAA